MSCDLAQTLRATQLMRSVKAVTHRSPFRGRQASPTAALCQRGRRAGPLVFALHMFHTRHGSLYSYHGPAPFPFLGARGVSEQATRGTDTAGGRGKTRVFQARARSAERGARGVSQQARRGTDTAGGRGKTRVFQARVRSGRTRRARRIAAGQARNGHRRGARQDATLPSPDTVGRAGSDGLARRARRIDHHSRRALARSHAALATLVVV